ncbi:MAG TPA: dihydropteroate synthase [Steroidobacteraceae bacterium]|nr:dihydropteroate synthase [Steroidobacteraceae bacterium]
MMVDCGSRQLDLATPVVMGVLNVTPDSFSDGGSYFDAARAVAHAHDMISEGARIIDVGGESTRPGAARVPVQEELRRVIPVIEALSTLDVIVSVDTSKAEVMRAAVAAGACMINDIRALNESGALEAAASTSAAVCLMHMQGQPATMQLAPHYDDVIGEVCDFLRMRIAACERAGIARNRLIIDPGIGFGKTLQHNLELLAHLAGFKELSCPLLVGVSRKSMMGQLLNRAVNERVHGGVAIATAALLSGAKIIRTHDVAATLDAVRVVQALYEHGYSFCNDM